ncbi:MAG: tetratricopeptide repeat protein, partial [Polyangiales bacterium]
LAADSEGDDAASDAPAMLRDSQPDVRLAADEASADGQADLFAHVPPVPVRQRMRSEASLNAKLAFPAVKLAPDSELAPDRYRRRLRLRRRRMFLYPLAVCLAVGLVLGAVAVLQHVHQPGKSADASAPSTRALAVESLHAPAVTVASEALQRELAALTKLSQPAERGQRLAVLWRAAALNQLRFGVLGVPAARLWSSNHDLPAHQTRAAQRLLQASAARQWSQALTALDALGPCPKSAVALHTWLEAELRLRRPHGTVPAVLLQRLQRGGLSEVASFVEARLDWQAGRGVAARERLEKLQRGGGRPVRSDILLLLARIDTQEGQWQAAAQRLADVVRSEAASALSPRRQALYRGLMAQLAVERGDFAAAMADNEKALALLPSHPAHRLLQARLLTLGGRYAAAAERHAALMPACKPSCTQAQQRLRQQVLLERAWNAWLSADESAARQHWAARDATFAFH